MLSDVLQENVHDHVSEIHEDPFRGRRAFDAQRPVTLSGKDAVDVIRNCPGLALRFPGTQHEIVCNGGQFGDMQDEDIGGLLVEDRPRYRESLGLSFRCDRCPPSRDRVELYRIQRMGATRLPRCGPAECVVEFRMRRYDRAEAAVRSALLRLEPERGGDAPSRGRARRACRDQQGERAAL